MKGGVSNISILVLGDEGVGKSSLISTFVSRHFPEQIPKLLTRVHLPPDPLLSDCTTTIVDTHDGDAALQNALSLSVSGSKDRESSVDAPVSGESPLSSSTPSPSSSFDDKQSAESFLASTVFRNVDAMVLVYDMSREDSFNRLEEYWLPLIERCYRGNIPVIIAGNKLDLFEQQQQQQSPSSQTTTARSRQQIISLLQRFKFVRQCIKCSAKNVLHVDDVFNKSKIAVMYPIKPLYDLVGGRLTPACSRAFTRIFRMFDLDRDGLLSDDELTAFQSKIWGETLIERDVIEWKNALSRHDSLIHRREEASVGSGSQRSEEVIVNDKITLTGFLTIIDIFISQNRLEVPWTALWTLGYDDELNLHIPESILSPGRNDLDSSNFDPSVWRLNASEVDFLSSIFYQFQSDGEGMLSVEDLHRIFSVFSTPSPPWGRSKKLLGGCFSLPRIDEEVTPPSSLVTGVTFDHEIEEQISADPSPTSLSVSAGGVTISSSPLPSIDVSKTTELDFTVSAKPLTYLSWMNHWHMFCTISPSRFRAELFSLGHVGDMPARSKTASTLPPSISPDGAQTIFIRALVLGSNDHAKRSIINNLHGIHQDCSALNLTHPETSCSVARVMLPNNNENKSVQDETETVVHLIVTEIPSSYSAASVSDKRSLRNKFTALLGKQNASGERVYDVAVLVFDTGDESSWEYAKDIDSSLLSDNMPRIFVGTRQTQSDSLSVFEHQNHCRSMDLEEPLTLSLDETIEDSSLLRHLVRCTQDESFRSIPHGERNRRLAALKKKCMWFTSVVSVGLVVVFVFRETKKAEKGSWRHYFHRLLPFN